MDYQWPRTLLELYKFDAIWPYDVNPAYIAVPFKSHEEENLYRIAQRKRIHMTAMAEHRHNKMMQDFRAGFTTW